MDTICFREYPQVRPPMGLRFQALPDKTPHVETLARRQGVDGPLMFLEGGPRGVHQLSTTKRDRGFSVLKNAGIQRERPSFLNRR